MRAIEGGFGICRGPIVRKEWRELSAFERSDFTRAVKCLSTIPSNQGFNGTVYDDFSILHEQFGSQSHRNASFLPWHRYALIIWENALRDNCGFEGHIPYWDWTMDWANLSGSSIWDDETGFGGDGNQSGPIVVGDGRCVTSGPFSELRPIIYEHRYRPHCLSRGFRSTDNAGRPLGPWFGPESIGKIMEMPTYAEFEWEIENRVHNRIHRAISGDFLSLAAANDPVFYLHHAQIDRLWWQWQNRDAPRRLSGYDGQPETNQSSQIMKVETNLHYGSFVDSISISKVMDTENGFLCYRY
ncbi:Di-copper centre-containing protein [Colletotrichum sublineola]|nr:Di-copper centre-containing protein [Colletotrichum sublineola]